MTSLTICRPFNVSSGCAQTPPAEPIIESNEMIVARWREEIIPLR